MIGFGPILTVPKKKFHNGRKIKVTCRYFIFKVMNFLVWLMKTIATTYINLSFLFDILCLTYA